MYQQIDHILVNNMSENGQKCQPLFSKVKVKIWFRFNASLFLWRTIETGE